MTQLCAQLERTQHDKDELAKEVGRLKLLAEQSKAINAPPQPRESLVNMQSKFPIKSDRPNLQRPYPDNRACFNCGETGHFVGACPKRRARYGGPSDNTGKDKKVDGNDASKVVRGMTAEDTDKACFLRMTIGGSDIFALLDSGSEVSIIPADRVDSCVIYPAKRKLFAANGTGIDVKGEAKI